MKDLSPDRWQRIDRLFSETLEQAESKREAFLRNACGGDAELFRAVMDLLNADADAADVLQEDAFKFASPLSADFESPPTVQASANDGRDRHRMVSSSKRRHGHFDNSGSIVDAASRHPTSLVGRVVSHFEILEIMDSGGMGVVYRARDIKLDRQVALKFMQPSLISDAKARTRFIGEAKAASALNHVNICTIYEIDEIGDNGLFMAMAFCEGVSLKDRIEGGSIEVPTALDYAWQIARGLSHAHTAGILHRDIKPANVMVADDVVKIVDFGLAKFADVDLTKSGTTLGTVAYMSPERIRGETVDARADIWSFGVLLYEMLAGERPFRAEYEHAVMYSIIHEDPKPLRRRRTGIPSALEHIVGKALRKRPADRYQTFDDLLADLEALRRGEGSALSVPASGEGQEHPFVGREKDKDFLTDCFRSAVGGKGLLACVAGEPGIGKTTLVTAFLEEIALGSRICMIAQGQCSERLLGTEAYLPFLETLTSLVKDDPTGSLGQTLRQVAPMWYVQVMPVSGKNFPDARLLEEIQSATQERMKRELAAFLQAVSDNRPLVLFIEDLHWADISTIDLLDYLSTRFDQMRLLVVTTYRPAEMILGKHPFLQIKPDLLARGLCREIVLDFLTTQNVAEYLDLAFAGHKFPSALAKLLHSRTEGSPLFMVDLIRELGRRDVIIRENGSWNLKQSPDEIELALPQSVRGMIQHKIQRVSDDDRKLLATTAVQGYIFDSAVVSRVLDLDAVEVEERLRVLERDHRLVRFVAEEEFPDQTFTLRYRFVHSLYQNELYDSLTRTKRVRLSKAVAEALLNHYGDQSSDVAGELAMLFEAARDSERAVHYFCQAAQNASRLFAYRESIVLAQRGLTLLSSLPDSQERIRSELNLLLAMKPALVATKGFGAPDVEKAHARSYVLCRQLDDVRQLHFVLPEISLFYQAVAQYAHARSYAEQFHRLAEAEDDRTLLMQAHSTLGSILFYIGDLAAADQHFEEGIERYDREQHRSLAHVTGDMGVYNMCHHSLDLWELGYGDRALKKINGALELSRQLSHPFSRGFAVGFAGNIHHGRREVDAVKFYADEGIAHSQEHGFPHWLAQGEMQLGWSLCHEGSADEGIELMLDGWERWKASGIQLGMAYWPCWILEACAVVDRTIQAEHLLSEAFARVARHREGFWVPELYRLKGAYLADEDEAEPLLRQALDMARDQNARSLELRAAVSLGRLLQQRGRRRKARDLISAAYSWFTEGFETADLREADALLTQLQE